MAASRPMRKAAAASMASWPTMKAARAAAHRVGPARGPVTKSAPHAGMPQGNLPHLLHGWGVSSVLQATDAAALRAPRPHPSQSLPLKINKLSLHYYLKVALESWSACGCASSFLSRLITKLHEVFLHSNYPWQPIKNNSLQLVIFRPIKMESNVEFNRIASEE